MIKKVETTKKVVVSQRHCDVCDKEIKSSLTCCTARCEMCKIDLCEECIGHEDPTLGDYRSVFCKSCWDKGTRYRKRIEELEDTIDKLYNEWQDSCQR